ncbi:SMI1/KNR4 family protein [Archangium sp.]|uniref:SMI1/KNR4 family protein n=1 Tax=Archangium sp. TaxID=1872627 RepID=UPI003899D4E2
MAALLRTREGGPPLTEEDVSAFEKTHGLVLPVAYKEFLLATHGGRPERDLFTLKGLEGNPFGRIHLFLGLNDPVVSCNLDWNRDVFRDRIPADLLPIATTEGIDKICLCVAGGRTGAICYWDGHARVGERSLYFLADDFTSFISSLHADELSPRMPEP